jgi:Flp pilus assembly protein TadG
MREMVIRIVTSAASVVRSRLGTFLGDARGTAAIEFAQLAPVLLLMLLATIEFGRAINVDRHFTTATGMAGDLVAREEYLGTSSSAALANLNGMMLSIGQIMQPYDATLLKLAIISVRASPTDATDTKVEWTYSYNGKTVPTKCQTYTVPTGLIDKGGSVIVVESSYVYKPLFASFVPGITSDLTWTDKSFHSPRVNSCVDYVKPSGNSCISTC